MFRVLYLVFDSLNSLVEFSELDLVMRHSVLELLLGEKGPMWQFMFDFCPVLLQKLIYTLLALIFMAIGARVCQLLIEQRSVQRVRRI